MSRTMNEIQLDLYEFAIEQGFIGNFNSKRDILVFEYMYEECKKDYILSTKK